MLDNPKYYHNGILYASETDFNYLKNKHFQKIAYLFHGHEILFATELNCCEHTVIFISKQKEIYSFYKFDWCYYCQRIFDEKDLKFFKSANLVDIINYMIHDNHSCYNQKYCGYIEGIYHLANLVGMRLDNYIFFLPLHTLKEIYDAEDKSSIYSYESFLYSATRDEFDKFLQYCLENSLKTIKMIDIDYFGSSCVLFFGNQEEIEQANKHFNGKYEIRPNMRELTKFPSMYHIDRDCKQDEYQNENI